MMIFSRIQRVRLIIFTTMILVFLLSLFFNMYWKKDAKISDKAMMVSATITSYAKK